MINFILIILICALIKFAITLIPVKYSFLFSTEEKMYSLKISFLFNLVLVDFRNDKSIIKISGLRKQLKQKILKNKNENIKNDKIINEKNNKYEFNVSNQISNKKLLSDYKNHTRLEKKNKKSFFDNVSNIYRMFEKRIYKEVIALIKFVFKHFTFKDFHVDGKLGISVPHILGGLLSIFSVLYSKFGNRINIKPTFNKNIFDIKIKFSGEVRLIYILMLIPKMLKIRFLLKKNKNIKKRRT